LRRIQWSGRVWRVTFPRFFVETQVEIQFIFRADFTLTSWRIILVNLMARSSIHSDFVAP